MKGNMTTDQKIIMYGRPMCPMVPPVEAILKSAEAHFEYIDIYQDDEARTRVREINHGNESVPTLVFPDGSTLTEPRPAILQRKLVALGYDLPSADLWKSYIAGQLRNPFAYIQLIALGLLLYAILEIIGVFN